MIHRIAKLLKVLNSENDPDQISFSIFNSGADCCLLTPADFPLLELTHGQVKVK